MLGFVEKKDVSSIDGEFSLIGVDRQEVIAYIYQAYKDNYLKPVELLLPEIKVVLAIECLMYHTTIQGEEHRQELLSCICEALGGTLTVYEKIYNLLYYSSEEIRILEAIPNKKNIVNHFHSLIDALNNATEEISECNDLLGFQNHNKKNYDELTTYFTNPPENISNINNFNKAKIMFNKIFKEINNLKTLYINNLRGIEVCSAYMKHYYIDMNGVIPFQPNAPESEKTSIIDIIALMKNCQVVIWGNISDNNNELTNIYHTPHRAPNSTTVPNRIYNIKYNGLNHFTALKLIRGEQNFSTTNGTKATLLKAPKITVSDNKGHIQIVEFYQSSDKFVSHANIGSSQAPLNHDALIDGEMWKGIQPFNIITGSNGKGKTHLLEYIKDRLKGEHQTVNFIYRGIDYLPGISSQNRGLNNVSTYDIAALNKEFIAYLNGGVTKIRDEHLQRIGFFPELEGEHPDFRDLTEEVQEEIIKKYADKYISYKGDYEISNPLNILYFVFDKYTKDKNAKITAYSHISNTKYLLEFYKQENPSASAEHFITCMRDKRFLQGVIEKYVDYISPKAPWEIINELLEQYKFKYRIDWDSGRADNEKLLLTSQYDSTLIIKPFSLSSGEKMILDIISWQYYIQGLSATAEGKHSEIEKTHIIILDEPDRHLDPKLSELFFKILYNECVLKQDIQVIMTTHRTDTLALAPEDSIFIFDHNQSGKIKITQCHKLRAMFSLTHNLRALTNLNIKVYTEAFNDAYFFEAIYSQLVSYSNIAREHNENTYYIPELKRLYSSMRQVSNTDQVDTDGWRSRMMSRRYQLSFHPTLAEGSDDGKGGCAGVTSAIKHDVHSTDKRVLRNRTNIGKILVHPDLELPFGILDADYNQQNHKAIQHENNKKCKNRITILKRHSLENYLFDPIILCSALNEEDIKELFKEDEKDFIMNLFNDYNEKKKFENTCLALCSSLKDLSDLEAIRSNISSYFHFLLKLILENITFQNSLIMSLFSQEQEVDNVGSFWGQITQGYNITERDLNDGKDKKSKDILQAFGIKNLKDFIKPNEQGKQYDKDKSPLHFIINALGLDIPEDKIHKNDEGTIDKVATALLDINEQIMIIVKDHEPIMVNYPKVFLYFRGHDIETVFGKALAYSERTLKQRKSELLLKIADADNIYIPLDLAEGFFELNERVRNQFNAKLKAESREI